MMKNVTLRQLRIFNEVARNLSFSQAAVAMHLTPPAISMQIRELEEQIGLPLFERGGRKVQLTVAGEYVLNYARRILAALKEADDAIARLRQLEAGQLIIGMVSTAQYFLPMLLAQFRAQHRGVDIRLAVGNRAKLLEWLRAGEVDIAVMGRPPQEWATHAEIFAKQPHVFVAPVNHPLVETAAQNGALSPKQLEKHPFIVREIGSGTLAALERFCAENHVTLQTTMEMSSNETIKQAVMAGMGLSFLSLHTIGTELRHNMLSLLSVQGAPIMRDWHCVHMQDRVLSPAAEAFRHFVLSHGEKFLTQTFQSVRPVSHRAD